jgi:hypothetical protein
MEGGWRDNGGTTEGQWRDPREDGLGAMAAGRVVLCPSRRDKADQEDEED